MSNDGSFNVFILELSFIPFSNQLFISISLNIFFVTDCLLIVLPLLLLLFLLLRRLLKIFLVLG